MWKKEEEQTEQPQRGTTHQSGATGRGTSSQATLGPSIRIDGDVTGSENLLIQGQVDGSVTLKDHTVAVGKDGRVNADIVGRIITIEGRVEGDLTAAEQIVLRGTAQVKGDIKAPRVVLEDGATFRGLVDMGAAASAKGGDGKTAASGTTSKTDASSTSSEGGKASSENGSSDGGKGSASGSSGSEGSTTSGKKATQKASA